MLGERVLAERQRVVPAARLARERGVDGHVRERAARKVVRLADARLLGDRVDVYSNRYIDQVYGEQQADGAWIRYVLSIVPTLFFLRYRLQIKKAFPQQYQLLLIGALFVCSLLLAGAISSVALHRFNFYALPLAALMVVYGTKAVARRPVIMRLAWLGMFGGYQVAWFTFSSNARSCLMPYDNIVF